MGRMLAHSFLVFGYSQQKPSRDTRGHFTIRLHEWKASKMTTKFKIKVHFQRHLSSSNKYYKNLHFNRIHKLKRNRKLVYIDVTWKEWKGSWNVPETWHALYVANNMWMVIAWQFWFLEPYFGEYHFFTNNFDFSYIFRQVSNISDFVSSKSKNEKNGLKKKLSF